MYFQQQISLSIDHIFGQYIHKNNLEHIFCNLQNISIPLKQVYQTWYVQIKKGKAFVKDGTYMYCIKIKEK